MAACVPCEVASGENDSSRRRASVAAMLLFTSIFSATPGYTQVDMNKMMQRMDAKTIHWSVVGDYASEDLNLNLGTSGYAPAKDYVEFGFDCTLEGNVSLVGTPTLINSATQMGALRNGADGCRAPKFSGKYEHSTIETLENGFGCQLMMKVSTDFQAGQFQLPAQVAIRQHYQHRLQLQLFSTVRAIDSMRII